MMESTVIKVAEIYVPTKRRSTLDPDKVETLAESILEEGQKMPIQVRRGNNRYVLIEGLHRLEAVKSLGESTIEVLIVAARRH
ncbi:MAG: ParB N-terminal domain-containing protein [Alphaproteobacteria bacterium]|nr:ParB N-terminal domain-containing protein [Alphaproteobacteria bacterium]NQV60931.1 ParB N-terminal domain-containing protein [Alphaproteobacteria bacterium]